MTPPVTTSAAAGTAHRARRDNLDTPNMSHLTLLRAYPLPESSPRPARLPASVRTQVKVDASGKTAPAPVRPPGPSGPPSGPAALLRITGTWIRDQAPG